MKYYLQRLVKRGEERGKWIGVEMLGEANCLVALEYMTDYMSTTRANKHQQHRVIDSNGDVICTYNPTIS